MSDPFNPTGTIPNDQAMLLRVIDARFETSNTKVDAVATNVTTLVASIQALTSKYDKRFDDHEHRLSAIEGDLKARALQVADFENHKVQFKAADGRIADLEKWQTEEQTTSKNASKWGALLWGAFGSGVTTVAMFVATMFFQAQPPVTVNNNGANGMQQGQQGQQGQHPPTGQHGPVNPPGHG